MNTNHSRRKSPSSVTGNCITDHEQGKKSEAKLCSKDHARWEGKQRFEIIVIDAKTVKYRLIKTGEKVSNKLIHKGKI